VYDFASHAWSCRAAFSVSVYIISPISLGYGLIQLPVFSLVYLYFSFLPLIVENRDILRHSTCFRSLLILCPAFLPLLLILLLLLLTLLLTQFQCLCQCYVSVRFLRSSMLIKYRTPEFFTISVTWVLLRKWPHTP